MLTATMVVATVPVTDLDQAKRFYGETLGQDVSIGEMGILEMRLAGGATVMVYPKADHAPATYTILNFPVKDIDAAVNKLTSAGVKMKQYGNPEMQQDGKGIARDPRGPAIAWFKDPSGNILAVLQNDRS